MEYAFIDGTKSDRATRKLARSHAMKGKNVGKTRLRRSRLRPGASHTSTQPVFANDGSHEEESSSAPAHGTMSFYHVAWGGDALLSAPFPFQATPQSQDVINQCK
jgi:hypothetical protein